MNRMGQGQYPAALAAGWLACGIVGSKGFIQGIPCVEQLRNTIGSCGSRRLFSRPASEQRSLHCQTWSQTINGHLLRRATTRSHPSASQGLSTCLGHHLHPAQWSSPWPWPRMAICMNRHHAPSST